MRLDNISTKPSVPHGTSVVAGTRVPVWVVLEYADDGLTPKEIADAFDDCFTPQVAMQVIDCHGCSVQRAHDVEPGRFDSHWPNGTKPVE